MKSRNEASFTSYKILSVFLYDSNASVENTISCFARQFTGLVSLLVTDADT